MERHEWLITISVWGIVRTTGSLPRAGQSEESEVDEEKVILKDTGAEMSLFNLRSEETL